MPQGSPYKTGSTKDDEGQAFVVAPSGSIRKEIEQKAAKIAKMDCYQLLASS